MGGQATKIRRHNSILELLRRRQVSSQDDLVRGLRAQGFVVTQSTLSRDLKELQVSRVFTATGYRYQPPGEAANGERGPGPNSSRLRSVAAEEVLQVESNETAVVVRTLNGRAQGVAAYLDALRPPDLLATIAGDDTILVLPRTTRKTTKLRRELAELFHLGDEEP